MPRDMGVNQERVVWKSREETFKDSVVKNVDCCEEAK